MGCPKREQIDIENILRATGIDISANTETSAQNSDNSAVNSAVNDFKSDSSVTDSNDEPNEDQETGEPCHDLWGYYRISCLYDQTIKGVKHVNNANRFAQSFDDRKFQNSIEFLNKDNYDSTQRVISSSKILSSDHCLNFILIFVISLINCLNKL